MKYLIFTTEQDSLVRNEEIAITNGCTSDVTTYWFAWLVSYSNPPETAFCVPDNQIIYLTPSEVLQLKDEAYMEANDWFPPIKIG